MYWCTDGFGFLGVRDLAPGCQFLAGRRAVECWTLFIGQEANIGTGVMSRILQQYDKMGGSESPCPLGGLYAKVT